MKKKRNFHQNIVEKRFEKIVEKRKDNDRPLDCSTEEHKQETADDDVIQSSFSVVIGSKRKQSDNTDLFQPKKKKYKNVGVKDEENYLSYRPADFQSEKGYSLGTSFDHEVANATLDLTGDEENDMKKKNSQMKWDRKKKKFVQDSSQDPKKKKIRTESGAYIPASYKSNAYKEWRNKNKIGEAGDDSDDDDNNDSKSRKQQKQSRDRFMVLGTKGRRWHTKGIDNETNTGGKRNKFKRGKNELKRPEQILKSRHIKAKKQAFQKQRQKLHQKRRSIHDQKTKKRR